jgi:hypothetical protein
LAIERAQSLSVKTTEHLYQKEPDSQIIFESYKEEIHGKAWREWLLKHDIK